MTYAYRLGPQASLADSVNDCIDASSWCRIHLPSILKGDIDIEAFAVGGHSAGSSMSSLLGHILETPTPRIVVDIYGPVDFLTMPQLSYPVPPIHPIDFRGTGSYTESFLMEQVLDRDPMNAIIAAPFGWELDNIPESTTQHRCAVGPEHFSYTERVRLQTRLTWGSKG